MDPIKSSFLKKHGFHIGLLTISLAHLIFLIAFAGVKSLWHDDIYQLFFSWDRSFKDSFATVLRTDLNPPLWPFISFLWLKIAPYGTAWLKLPATVMTVAAGYVFGLSLKEVFDKRMGLFGAFVFAVSPLIVLESAYTFRAYGLYLFASSLLIYAYIRKTKYPSVQNRVFFGCSVFLISFSHYFGAFLCVFLGAFDLILAIRKKQKFNFFIEYVIVALLELAWLIPQITTITDALSDFWPPTPTLKSAMEMIRTFLHNSRNLSVIFWVLVAVFAVIIIRTLIKKGFSELFEHSLYFRLVFILTPLLMISATVIYCNINPKSSLWVYRYFFCLYPMIMFFLVSMLYAVIKELCMKIKGHLGLAVKISSLCLIAVMMLINYGKWMKKEIYVIYEPFEHAANVIMAEQEIKDGESVIVYNTTDCGRGWMYYLSRNHKVNTDNISLMDNTNYADDKNALLSSMSECDTVYIYAEHLYTDKDADRFNEIRQHMQATHDETILDDDRDDKGDIRWGVLKYQKRIKQ